MKKKIWLSPPHMGGAEHSYVQEAFESNWLAPLGPNVTAFEQALENQVGGTHSVAALSSGTAALHLALQLLGVGKGDEVLCQSFTFAASANPITYVGATPIFIDSEPTTWNLSPVLLEQAINERIAAGKKPAAIIAVHLYGMPYPHEEIHTIAARYAIPVIEDAAEALGSTYKGQPCGSLGTMGVFSFNGNKIITTTGGGALVCSDTATKQQAVFLATQARDDAPHYEHSQIGYNYRMSNVLAGIGRGQLEVLAERVAQRQANFRYYQQHLSDLEIAFQEAPEGAASNRWLTCIVTPSSTYRDAVLQALAAENIEARPLWKPMHVQPVFANHLSYTNGVSEELFNRGLCLPSGSSLTTADLSRIVTIVRSVFI